MKHLYRNLKENGCLNHAHTMLNDSIARRLFVVLAFRHGRPMRYSIHTKQIGNLLEDLFDRKQKPSNKNAREKKNPSFSSVSQCRRSYRAF